jgi:ProP effector
MSNGSLKEQLSAVASQFSDPSKKTKRPSQPAAPRPTQQQRPQSSHPKPRPADKVQKPKPRWLEYAQYGVDLLKVYFPATFKSMSEVKPLKKGIKEDLLKRLAALENVVTEDKACMVKSLSYYVNTQSYHKCVIAGAERLDLDGQPAGVVTAEEAKYSVDKQQARIQAKKQQTATVSAPKSEEALTEEPA